MPTGLLLVSALCCVASLATLVLLPGLYARVLNAIHGSLFGITIVALAVKQWVDLQHGEVSYVWNRWWHASAHIAAACAHHQALQSCLKSLARAACALQESSAHFHGVVLGGILLLQAVSAA